MASEKWYNSRFFSQLGEGVSIAAICVGLGIGFSQCSKGCGPTANEVEIEKAKAQPRIELKVGDYNGNQILDKYYEINGVKVPVEVDGKPVIEYFRK